MITTRTPFRISFAGGGSDLKSFYEQHEGCVVSASINKYMHISIHPTFNRENTVVKYSKTEEVTRIRDIQHAIARQILIDRALSGVEIVSIADIPSGTGLASSSAYTVGLTHAVNAFSGKYKSQEDIARYACEVEIDKLGEPIGKQDQYGVSVGGLKFIRFLPDGNVDVSPIIMRKSTLEQLEKNLLMFYTGEVRSASAILEEQSNNMKDVDKFDNLKKMTGLAYDLKAALEEEDLSKFGMILDKGWKLKRELASKISNPLIDKYYDLAIENGALGGKLLGAGGGGFLLFYCEEAMQDRLRSALYELTELPFKFDYSGTKVIYVGEKDWD